MTHFWKKWDLKKTPVPRNELQICSGIYLCTRSKKFPQSKEQRMFHFRDQDWDKPWAGNSELFFGTCHPFSQQWKQKRFGDEMKWALQSKLRKKFRKSPSFSVCHKNPKILRTSYMDGPIRRNLELWRPTESFAKCSFNIGVLGTSPERERERRIWQLIEPTAFDWCCWNLST